MQDRYAADLGDYVKFAILRRLEEGRRLGVLWWLYPDEAHNADGKHVAYLERPSIWRPFDPLLFDKLKLLIAGGDRSVGGLERSALLTDASYFAEPIPVAGNAAERRAARNQWFARAEQTVAACDLVFLDPDNGLETSRFDPGRSKAGKSVSLSELQRLQRPGRTIIVYHHQTRMSGGHIVELAYWGGRLAELGFRVDALRAGVGTARAFFLLDATDEVRDAAAEFARTWQPKVTWHPELG